jgi:putative DNA primase/helicase
MTSTTLNTPKDYAEHYSKEYGFSVFVLQNPETGTEVELKNRKRPAVNWELFNIMRPSQIQLDRWFSKNPNYNLAAATGSISKMVGLDVDGPNAAKRIEEKRMEMSTNLRMALDNTMMNKTGSGGYHFIFKIEDYIGDLSQKVLWTDGKTHSQILLQANNHYLVMPPSRHPSGKFYAWNGKDPQLITRQELNELIRLVRPNEDQQPANTEKVLSVLPTPPSEKTLTTDKMQELLKWVKPFYTPGNRDHIIFYLSGMLRKNGGYSQESTRTFIKLLCNGSGYDDEDLEKSLTVVDNTYMKPLDELNGKSGLHSLLITNYQCADQMEYLVRADAFTRICQIIDTVPEELQNGNNGKEEATTQEDGEKLLAERAKSDMNTKIIAYIVRKVMDNIHLKTYLDTGEVFYRDNNNNIYCPFGEQIIDMESEKIGDFAVTSHMKKEVIKHIKDKTAVPRSLFNSQIDIVNVKNGLLNIFTGELKEHTPEHLSTIQLPVNYDPNAECPQTEKFLSDVIQDPFKLKEFLKFWAYILLKDCRYEKGVMFVGGGSNGKSVLIKLIEAHEGPENCSHVSLHDIGGDDHFAIAGLWGKTLNTYADLRSDKIKSSGNLKTIMSGDSIEAQHKFKPRFKFRNFAKIVYSANSPPETDDNTYVFYRRWLIIPFDRTFVNTADPNDPNKKDPDLINKLTTPEEMSGALNLRLKYLKVLLGENSFAEESFEVVKREYESRAEHITKYLLECCSVDFNNFEYMTRAKTLYSHYLKWCEMNKIMPLHETTFGSKLLERGIVKKDKKPKGQERGYFYMNVALNHELYGGSGTTTLEQAAVAPEAPATITTTSLELLCQHCGQAYSNDKDLLNHIVFKHPGESLELQNSS